MYGRMFIFVENFHGNNLSVVLEIFHVFNFCGTGYPRKLFNLEYFPIYGILIVFKKTILTTVSNNLFLKTIQHVDRQ